MTVDIPDDIVRYVVARDQQRAEQVDQAWAALTERERALVREAAVMGYVRGVLSTGTQPTIPPDSTVVRTVIGACQAMPDLYPTLGGEGPPT